jgi:glycosyltransferase involved in cell wall biosynthesis
MISVVIPVKDGGDELARCLAAIRDQSIDDAIEIVVVDSGSRDDSVAIARAAGATVYEISPAEFNHGSARNLGASRSSGETIVFVSQDACPVGRDWLALLTAPLKEPESDLAGVYGSQLPHRDARPPEVFFLNFLYGSDSRRQRAASVTDLSMATTLFSNVNAAIPRSVWERLPFVEDIIMSEDQEWSRRALLAGFSLLYEPRAAVRHSHNYTIGSAFRRFFDSGVSAERAYLAHKRESGRVLRAATVRYAYGEISWLARTGQWRWIPYAAIYEGAKLAGLILGAHHRHLPLVAKRRWSALPAYWDRTR